MRFCQYCGVQIADEAAFCPQCGAPVDRNFQNPSPYRNPYPPPVTLPTVQLCMDRSLIKYILLSIITLGIYALVVMSHISEDINTIAGRYDGLHTKHYCLVVFVFSWLTLGIYPIVWMHKLCKRIGTELTRRGISYEFGADTFWLWDVLGTFILVGPFIFTHRLLKSMNYLAADYNMRG